MGLLFTRSKYLDSSVGIDKVETRRIKERARDLVSLATSLLTYVLDLSPSDDCKISSAESIPFVFTSSVEPSYDTLVYPCSGNIVPIMVQATLLNHP